MLLEKLRKIDEDSYGLHIKFETSSRLNISKGS